MSETDAPETPEQVRRHLELRGFTREQALAAQQAAAQMAQAQVRRAANVTSSFLTTVIALISSAFGFVAALAWNAAIQQWLNENYKIGDKPSTGALVIYALAATVFAVIVITVLGIINSRIKGGKNLLTASSQPPTNP